jgi:membrane-bound lytic murein transglycosylase B
MKPSRKILLLLWAALPILGSLAGGRLANAAAAESFEAFLAGLRADATAQGITRPTFDAAFAGVTPDPGVLAAMRHAPEYGKPMSAYLASLVSPARVAMGLRQSARWADTLRAVDKRFAVAPPILLSIWGIESSFGEAPDRWDVFRSLATLANARFQHPLFRNELLSALVILQQGRIARRQFVGSWAGAMGQAQFLPSSYLKYAVDFDGDGRPDIWNSVPDVLASIANYLHKAGWQPGLPWGFEVMVPQQFDYRISRGTFQQWAISGFQRVDGTALPSAGDAILFFPSGAGGPAFLVTANFNALKTFNNSDAYALAVGELADRFAGRGPIRAAWPASDFQPSRGERMALQRRLADLGYKVADFTGHIDFDLRDDIRQVQRQNGMIPDGYPSRALLKRIGVDAH